MPRTIDPELLINDDDVRDSVLRFNRERNTKRIAVVAIMLAALVAGILFTLLAYAPL
jgi:hypothetical protein